MLLEAWPACESILLRDAELRLCQRRGMAFAKQLLRFIFQVAKVGPVGKRAGRRRRVVGHGASFRLAPVVRKFGPKEGVGKNLKGWAWSPFRGPAASLTLCGMVADAMTSGELENRGGIGLRRGGLVMHFPLVRRPRRG